MFMPNLGSFFLPPSPPDPDPWPENVPDPPGSEALFETISEGEEKNFQRASHAAKFPW